MAAVIAPTGSGAVPFVTCARRTDRLRTVATGSRRRTCTRTPIAGRAEREPLRHRLIDRSRTGYPRTPTMKPHGTYKLSYRRRAEPAEAPEAGLPFDPIAIGLGRCQRIVDSLRFQILHGGPEQSLRIRQIFSGPREIFRVEISEPDLRCSRTTLLDRDALEDLLETDGVRERVLAQYAD